MRASHNPAGRRQYAIGLQASVNDKDAYVKNLRVTTSGSNDTELEFVGDGMDSSDCLTFSSGVFAQAAASIGFTRVNCKNRISEASWSLPISFNP